MNKERILSAVMGCVENNVSDKIRTNVENIMNSEIDKIMLEQKIPSMDDAITKANGILDTVLRDELNLERIKNETDDSRIGKEVENFTKTKQAVLNAAKQEKMPAPNYTLYDYILSRLSINPLGRGNVKGFETIRDGYMAGIKLEAPKFMQGIMELGSKKEDVIAYARSVMDGTNEGYNELRNYIAKISKRLEGVEDVNKDAFINAMDNMQFHNRAHIAGMTRDQYAKVLSENVDKNWLGEMLEKVKRVDNKIDTEAKLMNTLYDVIVSGKYEDNLSLRRELMSVKFKDAEGWVDYHYKTYGGKIDMQTMAYNHLKTSISEITLMSEFGNEPAAYLNKLKETLVEEWLYQIRKCAY